MSARLALRRKSENFSRRDVKSDIKAIRKEDEQKFLGALIKFHNCRIDRNQAQLRKAKSFNKNTSVKEGKSQSDSCNIPESLKADSLLQPIGKSQKSYLKDTTDFVNFIERRNLPEESLNLFLKRTHLNSTVKTISKHTEP